MKLKSTFLISYSSIYFIFIVSLTIDLVNILFHAILYYWLATSFFHYIHIFYCKNVGTYYRCQIIFILEESKRRMFNHIRKKENNLFIKWRIEYYIMCIKPGYVTREHCFSHVIINVKRLILHLYNIFVNRLSKIIFVYYEMYVSNKHIHETTFIVRNWTCSYSHLINYSQ